MRHTLAVALAVALTTALTVLPVATVPGLEPSAPASAEPRCDEPVFGDPLPVDVDLPHQVSTGRGVGVAVIDTGVDAPGVRTLNPADRDRCLLHGTAVAGVVRTVAPDATIVSVRQGTGAGEDPDRTTVADLVSAVNRARRAAAEHDVRVITMSVVACEDTAELRRAVHGAEDAGLLVVAAAGNTGQCQDGQVPYPAALPGVLTVGGVDARLAEASGAQLNAGRLSADYSTPGHWVDLHAPGGPVSAPMRLGETVRTVVGDPAPFTGTSFATPVVAATAALIWQVDPGLTATQVRSLLVDTAQHGVVDVVDPQAAVAAAADRSLSGTTVTTGATETGPFALPATVAVVHPTPEHRDLRIPLGLGALGLVAVLATGVLRGLCDLRRG